jgi:DNA-binding winged helix-turn-helix (wHTH) protein
VVVAPDNLKVQLFALRKGLGEDRDLVQTEHGRGYRFTATVNRLRSDPNERCRRPPYHAVTHAAERGAHRSIPDRPILISARRY